MPNEPSPSQWGLIATLLSMDAILPFHEAMGLDWPDKAEFVRSLRKLILDNRALFQKDPKTIPPLGNKLEALASACGADAGRRFAYWARNVFKQVHTDVPEWSAWHIIFFRWVFGQKNNDLIMISRVRHLIEETFSELANTDPLEKEIAEARNLPLSDWDLEMCAAHGMIPDDESADLFGPVVTTFEISATQKFFVSVIPKCRDEELKWIHAQGQRMITEMGVWLPGRLTAPTEMLQGIP